MGGIVVGEVARRTGGCGRRWHWAAMPLRTAREGLDVPTMDHRPPETMRLERERAGGWPEEETRRITDDAGHLRFDEGAGSLRPGPRHLPPRFHRRSLVGPALRWMGLAGPEHVAYAHGVIRDYTLAFFGLYLDGRDVSLDRLADTYPAASVESVDP